METKSSIVVGSRCHRESLTEWWLFHRGRRRRRVLIERFIDEVRQGTKAMMAARIFLNRSCLTDCLEVRVEKTGYLISMFVPRGTFGPQGWGMRLGDLDIDPQLIVRCVSWDLLALTPHWPCQSRTCVCHQPVIIVFICHKRCCAVSFLCSEILFWKMYLAQGHESWWSRPRRRGGRVEGDNCRTNLVVLAWKWLMEEFSFRVKKNVRG